jgi:serine/threonine-protein kinase
MPDPSSSHVAADRNPAPPVAPDATVISGRSPDAGRQTSVTEIGRSLEGHWLGPYRLDKFVGGGGMGAVFRALDTTLDRVVAVKVLSRQQSGDEEMLRRFRNEAQSAARLDHENIGRVHAVGSDDGWHYIVFEFIEGTNLRDVVQQEGPFGIARTIDVTIQVAEALEHASRRNVVHRDIKPSNIIITPAGRARVVDMGLARLHQVASDQDLTVSGMTLGTFDYISPEQARDPRSADVRSDLYSLGCTIFFMLVGRAPFAEGTMVQKLLAHQQDPPPAIEPLRPDVPRRFAAILTRLMEKDPADRYQRPADVVADLLAVADELGIEVASPRPAAAMAADAERPSLARHLPWLIPLVGLALVVGGLWSRAGRTGRQPAGAGRLAPGVSGQPQALATADETAATADETAAARTEDAAARNDAGAMAEPHVWRVVDVPTSDEEFGTIAEAVRQAADGDVVEIGCLEPRDGGPFTVEGRRITIRAASGLQPVLRLAESTSEDVAGRCCTVVSGTLELRELTVRPAFLAAGRRTALIGLQRTATLSCEQVTFTMPDEPAAAIVCVRSDRSSGDRQEVRMIDSRVEGAALFLEAGGGAAGEVGGAGGGEGGRIDLTWSGGRVVTPGRFLLAEGAAVAGGAGVAITVTLDDGLFACGDGLACLIDSPTRPRPASVRGLARGCLFLVPEGHALLEQIGVGDPQAYRVAIGWVDAGSRYQGSGVFRRIDAAAERLDLDYASHPQPLDHALRIEAWPSVDAR